MSKTKLRPSPTESATLNKVGAKKSGNDGNTWIVQENKNGVKRWTIYQKNDDKPKQNASKSKQIIPKFYELVLQLNATAYLWNQGKMKSHKIDKLLKGSELKKVLASVHTFDEPMQSSTYSFKSILNGKVTIKWNIDKITINIPIKIKSDDTSVKKLENDIDFFTNGFLDGAADGYLEGDAVIYQVGDNAYEYVLDDLTLDIIRDNKIIKRNKYPSYWKK